MPITLAFRTIIMDKYMKKVRYSIAKEFSRTPGPRYEREGQFSGEKFRKEYFYPRLLKAIKDNEELLVDLDGVAGFGTSFLEEGFGGLIRENGLELTVILKHVKFKSDEEDYLIDDINSYLKQANDQCVRA